MYRCAITGKLSRQGDPRTGEFYHVGDVKTDEGIRAPEKLNKIVVQTREKVYTRWIRNDDKAEGIDRALVLNESADRKWLEVFVAKGWEIVKEINASQEGVALWNSWTEEERAMFLKHLD